MKIYILLILAILSLQTKTCSQNFWEPISPPHDSVITSDIAVGINGYIYTSNYEQFPGKGGVYRSINNGISWELTGYADYGMESIAVTPLDHIITAGVGRIYKSADYGNTWDTVFEASTGTNILRIKSGFDSIVFALGVNQHSIIRSSDYGNTWRVVHSVYTPEYEEDFTDVAFAPDGTIYACSKTLYGGCGKIYRSLDLGNTWQVFGLCNHFYALEIDNFGNVLAGGQGLYRYQVLTQTWETLLTYNYSTNDILVTPDNKIFIACANGGPTLGGAYVSDNNGESFFQINTGLSWNDLRRVTFDIYGRLIGTNSDIFRSYDTIITYVPDISSTYKHTLRCYPNPFMEYIDIIIDTSNIKEDDDFRLVIYDAFGKKVFNSLIKPDLIYRWKPLNLVSGLYIVSVTMQMQIFTTKIIKL